MLADNFVGSGTTLLVAREKGLSAVGFDLSQLAITVANTKVTNYGLRQLEKGLQKVLYGRYEEEPQVPERLSKAFTGQELRELLGLLGPILKLRANIRTFFLMALISTARSFSRAVADGGWFRWQEWPDRSTEIRQAFKSRATCMICDVQSTNWSSAVLPVQAHLADARKLPLPATSVDMLVTSPPYANRHDYSRVFHIDLLLLGLSEPQVTKLRRESVRSHVEARSPTGYKRKLKGYRVPETLSTVLTQLPTNADHRIAPLLKGYFEDMYLSLLEVERILRPGGRVAYVVGNVRHAGVMVPVDEIITELGVQVGLGFDVVWVMRLRGNSAQQMGQYGREPARESVVMFSKDSG